MADDYTIQVYHTEWADCINIVILMFDIKHSEHVGIIEVRAFRGESKHAGEGYIWNLQVKREHRGKGLAKRLLQNAEYAAHRNGSTTAVLEWDKRDSPQWVFDWYTRQGYDEKEFGNGYALMNKEL
jgi:ribosomal protein S18 acetylase RimI-like enzyme